MSTLREDPGEYLAMRRALGFQLDKLEHNQGLNITIVITNSTDAISFDVLKSLHMPFREPAAAASAK